MVSKKYVLVGCFLTLLLAAGCSNSGLGSQTEATPSSCPEACTPDKICKDGSCVPVTITSQEGTCRFDSECGGGGRVCEGGVCVTPTSCHPTSNPCQNPQEICDAGVCRSPLSCTADPSICGNRTCHNGVCITAKTCQVGSTGSCSPKERCIEGICVDVSQNSIDLCSTALKGKCGPGTICKNGACVPDCDDPCGGVCCDATKVCYRKDGNATCVDPCNKGEEMCGTGNALSCCNTATHGCFANYDEATNTWLSDSCKPLGDTCGQNSDSYCAITRYCDSKYSSCIRYDENPSLCLLPTVDQFEAEVKLYYKTPKHLPDYNHVMSAPMVMDVSGPLKQPDGKSDIIVNMYNSSHTGILRVISGTAGPGGIHDVDEYWNSDQIAKPFNTRYETTPAVGDLNGDGKPDILMETTSGLRAVEGKDGTFLWEVSGASPWRAGAPAIANLDHDGPPEVIWADKVIDGKTGNVLCTLEEGNMTPFAADLDETGNMEIIHGTRTYSFVKNGGVIECPLRPIDPDTNQMPARSPEQDFASVADIDKTSKGPEIVTISFPRQKLFILDRNGKELWSYSLSPSSRTGPPTLADFDGDEELEIAFADKSGYMMIKPLRDPVTHKYLPTPKKWRANTVDESSGMTGSTVFDFDGDGKAEAVYFDEENLHIYNGADGAVKMKTPNSSYTVIEYPLVVDIDGDGHADIVTIANEDGGHSGFRGVRVFTDKKNRWVSTRKVWNQYTYHYTNVNDNGTIPEHEVHHWKQSWSNTFRQNVQKGNNRLAPDLTPRFKSLYSNASCNAETERQITYIVTNNGSKEVPANTITNVVSVKKTNASDYTEIDTRKNTIPLKPGESEEVTFTWPIDTQFQGETLDFKVTANANNDVIECRDANNSDIKTKIAVAAPNLLVSIPDSSRISCSTTNLNVNFEISNIGAGLLPPGAAEVEVRVNFKDGTPSVTKRVSNTKNLDPNSHELLTLEIDLQHHMFKGFTVELVADPDDTITECNESDNTATTTSVISCYVSG